MSFDLSIFRLRPGFTIEQATEFDDSDHATDEALDPREALSAAQLREVAQLLRSHDQGLSERGRNQIGLSLTGQEGYSWDLDTRQISLFIPYSLSPREQSACATRIGACIAPLRALGFAIFDPQQDEEVASTKELSASMNEAFDEAVVLRGFMKENDAVRSEGKPWWRFW